MLWSCYIYIISIGIIFIFYRSIQWYIIIKMWAMYLLSDVWCFLITIKISKETQHMPNHVTKWIPFKVNLVIVTINTFETRDFGILLRWWYINCDNDKIFSQLICISIECYWPEKRMIVFHEIVGISNTMP